jgi:hypothetical protein
MFKGLVDSVRKTGIHIQEVRNEVGGADYAAEHGAAIAAMKDGKPLEAIAHSIQGTADAAKAYEKESPLSKLKRIRHGQQNTVRGGREM